MKIALHSVYVTNDPSKPEGFLEYIEELKATDVIGRHTLTRDFEEADAVLITEVQSHRDSWDFAAIHASPIVRKWRHKTFVYCDADRPLYVLPGFYPSIEKKWHDPSVQRSSPYFHTHGYEDDPLFKTTEQDLLFSFSGQLRNHPCRAAIDQLQHENSEIVDTSGQYIFTVSPEERARLQSNFRRQVARSQFVLCPRGVGVSSYRLFETLCAGRVPVIISDDWVEPHGPDWASCSVRVAERDVSKIPEILKERQADIANLQRHAEEAYATHFARKTFFHYIGETLASLQATAGRGSLTNRLRRTAPYLRVGAKVLAKKVLRPIRGR